MLNEQKNRSFTVGLKIHPMKIKFMCSEDDV